MVCFIWKKNHGVFHLECLIVGNGKAYPRTPRQDCQFLQELSHWGKVLSSILSMLW